MSASYDQALLPVGINVAQFALLRTVAAKSTASLSEIAKAVELDRSTVGRNVRVLERHKLLKSLRSDDDRRESVVALTEKGRTLLDEAVTVWETSQKAVEARFGEPGIAALRALLTAI